jgi:hypothetical protein
MDKIKLLVFFTFPLLLSSCSDENIINPIDSELTKDIIGTWKGESNYSITFFSNGFFIDSTYFENNPDTSFNNFGLFIRTGKYNISNSVLTLSEFYFSEVITNASIWMAFVSPPFEISIANNILKMKPFTLFDNIGNNKRDLWDNWETNSWLCQADAFDSSQTFYGTYQQIYTFIEDSTEYLHTSKFHNLINDSSYVHSSSRSFTYNPPYLDLPVESNYNMLVQFKYNKMYWYFDVIPEDLIKVR